MEFKYPKGFLRETNNLNSKRPQPSPLKHEQFLKDLGLDDDDTLADISCSSEDDSSDENQPTEIEFIVLQKELHSCAQQRDSFQEKNRELQKIVYQLKSHLKKEETSKRTRLKIVQRAHADGLKDKQNLIIHLQDLIEENGESAGLKMVSSIELLHQQKADLHKQLIATQERHEEELNLLEEKSHGEKTIVQDQQAIEEMNEENTKLVHELDETKKIHSEEIRKYEELLKRKEVELSKNKHEQDKKRRSDNSFRIKLDSLTAELDSSKRSHIEKERELLDIIKKQKEEIKRIENERRAIQKGSESLEQEMMSRLTSEKAMSSESTLKLQDENRRMLRDLDSCRKRIESLEEEASWIDRLRKEKEHLEDENGELETKIKKLESNLERQKLSSKERLHSIENELEETVASMQKHRKEASASYDELKETTKRNENQLQQEMEEINRISRDQKVASEKAIKKLEENLIKSKEQLKTQTNEMVSFKSQLDNKISEIIRLNEEFDMKNIQYEKIENELAESVTRFKQSEDRIDELENKITRNKVEKENYERQLAALSGESDNALAQKEKESGNLRIQLNSVQSELQAETKKNAALMKTNDELECKLYALNNKYAADQLGHQELTESLKQNYKHEILKLKASSAITTQTLSTKATTFQKALRLSLSNMKQMASDNKHLKREIEKFPVLLKDSTKQAAKQIADAVSEINENHKELVRKYRKEMKLRKKYHNELVELRGNIRVFVRVRPTISEDGPNAKIAISYDGNDDSLINVNNPLKGRKQTFELDRVFSSQSSQNEVYTEVQALVTSCLDGYHVCIFAYGQTGSGKTYTMEGTKANPGINQRALNDLFRLIEDRSEDWQYNVTVSLVEIYNESLKDLLNSKLEKLEIKMNADGSLFVHRLTSVDVKDLNDVNRLFQTGRTNRSTASTNMNEHSSRSHAVLIIKVTGTNKTTGIETSGKLNLIDLAGSERVSKSGASGDRLKEAQNINRSLSALGDVIHALRNKQSHVPFRNSKLTYLLQDSLSNDSKTLMLVQVSPIERSLGETVCSLTFAQRVRMVELGQATRKMK